MKSIFNYLYDKRAIVFEFLFWLFWFFNNAIYVGSTTNMFTSGALFWSFGNIIVFYITYRLALYCVRRLFVHYKYVIYLFLVYVVGHLVKMIVNEIIWQIALNYLDFGTFNHDYQKMINRDGGGLMQRLSDYLLDPIMFSTQASRWLPISLKIMIDLALEQRKNNALNKNKMDLEIKLLKSQINPQFINESLENIKNVVNTDPKKAEQMTLKLSNMIRYTLYETDVEKVALQKELDFMINYIDLQETRLADHANVNFRLKTHILDHLAISPLLIFPLLEKAFKCIKSNCEVDIKTQDAVLELKIESDYVPDCPHSGIENVQKRLAFLYPNKHRLKVIENEGMYKVDLKLEL